jgi:hypothetical protein
MIVCCKLGAGDDVRSFGWCVVAAVRGWAGIVAGRRCARCPAEAVRGGGMREPMVKAYLLALGLAVSRAQRVQASRPPRFMSSLQFKYRGF